MGLRAPSENWPGNRSTRGCQITIPKKDHPCSISPHPHHLTQEVWWEMLMLWCHLSPFARPVSVRWRRGDLVLLVCLVLASVFNQNRSCIDWLISGPLPHPKLTSHVHITFLQWGLQSELSSSYFINGIGNNGKIKCTRPSMNYYQPLIRLVLTTWWVKSSLASD